MKNSKFLTIALTVLCFQGLYIQAGFAIKSVYLVALAALVLSLRVNGLRSLVAHEYALLTFFAVFMVVSIGAQHPEMSLRFFFGVVLMFVTYYGIRAVVVESDPNKLLESLAAAGVAFSLASIGLYILGLASGGFQSSFEQLTVRWGVAYDRGIPRLAGVTKDPNFYMAFNCLFVLVAIARINTSVGKLLLALSLLTSILTFSRGGFIALLAGLIVFVACGRHYRSGALVLFIIAAIIGFSYAVFPDFSIFLERRIATAGDGSGRFDIWLNGLELFGSNKLFGIGAFNFLQENMARFGGEHYMHNTFLEVLVEGGLISFAFYLFFWMLLIISLMFSRPKGVDDGLLVLRTVAIGYTASTIMSLLSLSGSISEPFFLCVLLATYLSIKCCRNHEAVSTIT